MPPAQRIFTHDQLADTLSFYIQSDFSAGPPRNTNGRSGDARFVFGVFDDESGKPKPVAVGMYVDWQGAGPAKPQIIAPR